jgi:hypothetical protein
LIRRSLVCRPLLLCYRPNHAGGVLAAPAAGSDAETAPLYLAVLQRTTGHKLFQYKNHKKIRQLK